MSCRRCDQRFKQAHYVESCAAGHIEVVGIGGNRTNRVCVYRVKKCWVFHRDAREFVNRYGIARSRSDFCNCLKENANPLSVRREKYGVSVLEVRKEADP